MEMQINLHRRVLELSKRLDEEQWENRLRCRKKLLDTRMHLAGKICSCEKLQTSLITWSIKSSGIANPALLPGESLEEKYQQESEPSRKPEKLLLCSFVRAASTVPRGPKES